MTVRMKKLSGKRAHDDKLNPFMIINTPPTLTHSYFHSLLAKRNNLSIEDKSGKIEEQTARSQ